MDARLILRYGIKQAIELCENRPLRVRSVRSPIVRSEQFARRSAGGGPLRWQVRHFRYLNRNRYRVWQKTAHFAIHIRLDLSSGTRQMAKGTQALYVVL